MRIRSLVTLLASWFAVCLLPAAAQTTPPNTENTTVPLQYVPLPTPCRAVDTRVTGGFAAGEPTNFAPGTGGCNIPQPANGPIVYALNVTVIPKGPLGYLTIWPAGLNQPLVSTLNSPDGEIKANAALVAGGNIYDAPLLNGDITVYATDPTDLVLDVTGYFVSPFYTSSSQVYVPITPCRVVDTRASNGTFGSPSLIAGQQRAFLLADSSCNVPADAGAVSLNVTAVPIDRGEVGYVTVWGTSPTEPQTPPISTLNAVTGEVTANASIVTLNPSTYGSVSVYASNNTDLLLDVTGYFINSATPQNFPPESVPAGLSLYAAVAPCRVLDTRQATGEFQGELTVPFTTGNSCDVPLGAGAYVVNATVVPAASGLGFLALWPDGTPQPLVSTLNAIDGEVTSNMAIVGTNNGSIDAYASSPTQLILDTSGYFAVNPPFASLSSAQARVVFVGDQILAGLVQYANNPNWTFNPVPLNPDPTSDVVRAAFPAALAMNPRPNVVVIQIGNADMEGGSSFCGGDDPNYGLCGAWDYMIAELQAVGIKVIMGNLLPFGPNAPTSNGETDAAIDQIITATNTYLQGWVPNGIQVIDFNAGLGNGSGGYNPLYTNNGVLPNAAGYAEMVTQIQWDICWLGVDVWCNRPN
jgi:hypothetical protein